MMFEVELQKSIADLQSILLSQQKSEFSQKLSKISVYIQSVARSWVACKTALDDLEKIRSVDPEKYQAAAEATIRGFQTSMHNSVRFARLNLDEALVQALNTLVWRPKNPTKADEQKKATALQKTFDRLDNPAMDMLEHFRSSSDPLNKYLAAGLWGHEYLRKRKIDLEEYDFRLCEMLGCQETAAGKFLQSYAMLCRAIDEVEKKALQI
jgi:hypothetical protein